MVNILEEKAYCKGCKEAIEEFYALKIPLNILIDKITNSNCRCHYEQSPDHSNYERCSCCNKNLWDQFFSDRIHLCFCEEIQTIFCLRCFSIRHQTEIMIKGNIRKAILPCKPEIL